MAIKPILFNTEMVRAILDGRKTCTRRLVKPQPKSKLCYTFAGSDSDTWGYPNRTAHEIWGEEFKLPNDITEEELSKRWNPPYHTDDILYVRETWCGLPVNEAGHMRGHTIYYYKADGELRPKGWRGTWHPSIHMPKEAARIWLKVTDVRVERLQEIKTDRERRRENERRGGITFEVIRNSDNKKFTVYDIVRTQHYTYFMIYDGGWKYIDADLFRECDKN